MKAPLSQFFNAVLFSVCLLLVPVYAPAQVRRPDFNRERLALGIKAADPFDVGTGIYSREYLDLFVKDTIPINFVRTQRNMDTRSRSFGVGGSTSYDMFIIGDVARFSWVALVHADGSQTRYERVSPGTGFADGVFESRTTPGKFIGSRISWNRRGAWTVALQDGTQITIQGCDATSKPGQCAVSQVQNARGERLSVQRDRAGNILRITSPHSHFISVTNDSDGRITKVQDDLQEWVSYQYDDKGCLMQARNWRGDEQRFAYDGQFNMTFVHEIGPPTVDGQADDFTISNRYDEQNRFEGQTLSTGEAYSAKYITDSDNRIRQTDVRGPDDFSRYFFNEDGYETRQEFRSVKGLRWTFDRVRSPNSNATVEVLLTCRTAKIHLPLEFDIPLGEGGEARDEYLSQTCMRAERRDRAREQTPSKSGH
jgi:hypothetical protein